METRAFLRVGFLFRKVRSGPYDGGRCNELAAIMSICIECCRLRYRRPARPSPGPWPSTQEGSPLGLGPHWALGSLGSDVLLEVFVQCGCDISAAPRRLGMCAGKAGVDRTTVRGPGSRGRCNEFWSVDVILELFV